MVTCAGGGRRSTIQLVKKLAQASKEGNLQESGCLSYNYEQPAAAAAAAAAVKVEEDQAAGGGGGGGVAGDECYKEGQVVWVRGGVCALRVCACRNINPFRLLSVRFCACFV